MNQETREPGSEPQTIDIDLDQLGAMQRVGRHAKRQLRQVLDHVWGPTGSVILHVFLLFALIHWVSFAGRDQSAQIDVMIVEPETMELEDIQRELDQLPEMDVQIAAPEVDIMMEAPPDVQRQDAVVQDSVAALDIRSEVQSPLVMRGLFAGRTAAGRGAMLQRFAGRRAQATEAAVLRALEWLKVNQLEDGSWADSTASQNKAAMTGLGLLTFLAHGETPSSERYGPTVERAIRYLIQDQIEATGRFRTAGGSAYAHGIATYALGEAFALTRIPSIQPVVERGLRVIITGQQPTGAFNYGLQASETRRDTSVMGWQAQAMKAAYIAGINTPGLEEAMERAAGGFKINFGSENNMFAYAPGAENAGERPTRGAPGNTSQAVLSLQLLGHANSREAQLGVQSISDRSCSWGSAGGMGSRPLYNWYYHTQAMFHRGGQPWEAWNRQFSAAFLGSQNADGSWMPFTDGESANGPVYGTTFTALTLMVYYRFLPTYQPIQVEAAPTQESADDILIEIL